ncbi:MAG: ATP synthase F0 subunit C [Lachnospiraceae bacterium]|nr:ATP synthase F0 subunit C [Lachnospiraceae bacterium]MBR6356521.1 ATP synthase F0 subunit C [Lachnospiraceae bacterium]MBR7076745.1 ATP synthase F0 subunit C [Lachnospiraceae bacterium]
MLALCLVVLSITTHAEEAAAAAGEVVASSADSLKSTKAIAAAIVMGLAAAAGAIAMALAISKSADGIARQPEAEGKIRTTLMLGLVFIETAIIYALIVAILIIFVL